MKSGESGSKPSNEQVCIVELAAGDITGSIMLDLADYETSISFFESNRQLAIKKMAEHLTRYCLELNAENQQIEPDELIIKDILFKNRYVNIDG